MITRRECLRYLSAGTGAVFAGSAVDAFAQTSPYKGVVLGVQSYSFRDRGLDEAIAAMQQARLDQLRIVAGPCRAETASRATTMRQWREDDAARGVPRRPREVREGRHSHLRLQHQLQGRLQRCRNRAGLRLGEGARHRHHHGVGEHATVVKRVVPVAAQRRMMVGHAQSLAHRSQRVRDAGDFVRGDEPVAAHRGEPRHRPLHGRQLRCGRVPARTSRAHRHAAHQGSQTDDGPNMPLRRRRHADRARCCGCCAIRNGRFPRTSNTNTRAAIRSKKCGAAWITAGGRSTPRRQSSSVALAAGRANTASN